MSTHFVKRYYKDLSPFTDPKRVLVIYGPRRVGKTTLVKAFLSQQNNKYKYVSGDDIRIQEALGSQDLREILSFIEGYELVVIDEAQNIPHIGMGLKLIVDHAPGVTVIATGSSSFELASQVGEPLTGRKRVLTLYPLAQMELLAEYNRHELKEQLETFLLFGSYPEVVTASTQERKIFLLQELVDSYVLRDILALERVKGSAVLLDLLRLLAFQIGHEVSLNELARQLRLDVKTVARYLDLLEKSFVIVSVGAFSRNLRSEIARKRKYYFLDTGVRNAIISQFQCLSNRNDVGQLWENFVVVERLKRRSYTGWYGSWYFWRTYSGQEIDLVEEFEGKISAYECKWSTVKTVKPPAQWREAYIEASFSIITKDNYLDFVT